MNEIAEYSFSPHIKLTGVALTKTLFSSIFEELSIALKRYVSVFVIKKHIPTKVIETHGIKIIVDVK